MLNINRPTHQPRPVHQPLSPPGETVAPYIYTPENQKLIPLSAHLSGARCLLASGGETAIQYQSRNPIDPLLPARIWHCLHCPGRAAFILRTARYGALHGRNKKGKIYLLGFQHLAIQGDGWYIGIGIKALSLGGRDMSNRFRRLMSALMAIVMLFTAVPAQAFAAQAGAAAG